jgi:anaerobic selenocysteine-containing dehydrogenase
VGTGESVELRSAQGVIIATAQVTDDVRQGTVAVPHGFIEPNVSDLTEVTTADRLTGMIRQSGIPVTLTSAGRHGHSLE